MPARSSRLLAVVGREPVDHHDRDYDIEKRPDRVVWHHEHGRDRGERGGDDSHPAGDFRAGLVTWAKDQDARGDQDYADDQPYPPIGREAVPEHRTLQAIGDSAVV